jgi:hypothetical protein
MFESVSQSAPVASTMDPITALTLILAALAVLLTALAIFIGLAAIWGYGGLKDSVKEMATRRVDEAVKRTRGKCLSFGQLL